MDTQRCPCDDCGLNTEEYHCHLDCSMFQEWLESEDEEEE